jgi:hypothetical protein
MIWIAVARVQYTRATSNEALVKDKDGSSALPFARFGTQEIC